MSQPAPCLLFTESSSRLPTGLYIPWGLGNTRSASVEFLKAAGGALSLGWEVKAAVSVGERPGSSRADIHPKAPFSPGPHPLAQGCPVVFWDLQTSTRAHHHGPPRPPHLGAVPAPHGSPRSTLIPALQQRPHFLWFSV